MSGRAGIVGLGTALPAYAYGQMDLAEWLCGHFAYPDRAARFVRRIHARSEIERRWSVLPDFGGGEPRRLFEHGRSCDIQARMRVYAEEAPPLAARACRRALVEAGMSPEEVTHLIVVTSTGFMTPGPDVPLLDLLSLRPTVERTVVAMHGCAGGTVGLSLAARIARTDPRARVLMVCIELCSIHLGAGDGRAAMVANSLFGDGAAAAVVVDLASREPCLAALGDRYTAVAKDADDLLGWHLLPSGFELTLSRRLPHRLEMLLRESPAVLAALESKADAAQSSWIVHSGGAAILRAVQTGLSIPEIALAGARSTLRNHGNISSASVLFTLRAEIDRVSDSSQASAGAILSFGPGFTIDLLRCSLRG